MLLKSWKSMENVEAGGIVGAGFGSVVSSSLVQLDMLKSITKTTIK
jgi:hypothetical protein